MNHFDTWTYTWFTTLLTVTVNASMILALTVIVSSNCYRFISELITVRLCYQYHFKLTVGGRGTREWGRGGAGADVGEGGRVHPIPSQNYLKQGSDGSHDSR